MANKPNVVFMLVDNTGWGDLSCYGALNPTPRLDQLASEGIRFTNHNTEAQCTPYPQRPDDGTHAGPLRHIPGSTARRAVATTGSRRGSTPWGICSLTPDTPLRCMASGTSETSLEGSRPTKASTSGGASVRPPTRPPGRPILCIPPNISHVPRSRPLSKASPLRRSTNFNMETRPFMDEKITDKTIDFIRRNHAEGKPFYAYVGFTNVHPPMVPHPDFEDATDSPFPSPKNLAELDHRAGQILDVLDELGIAEEHDRGVGQR